MSLKNCLKILLYNYRIVLKNIMIDELKLQKFIVIGYHHYNPLGVIRSLGEHGIRPDAILLKGNNRFVSKSKYLNKIYNINSYDEVKKILDDNYINNSSLSGVKIFIFPCDDDITEYFDKNYDYYKDKIYVSNAHGPGIITRFMDKLELCKLAESCGVQYAKTWKVKRYEFPLDLEYPVITKPLTSYVGWKNDYYICNNKMELNNAYDNIHKDEILLQKYIKKKNELCLDGFSINNGKTVFITIQSIYTYLLPDYYSMEMIVSNFKDVALKHKIDMMFEKIGYEGIFSIEFLIDENDNLWFLEINFRNSTWSYASTKLGMNLPLLWAEGMINGKSNHSIIKTIPKDFIALAEIPDYEQRVRRLKMISFKKWFEGVKKANCLYIYNKLDKKPSRKYWINKIKGRIRRIIFGK